MTKYVIERYDTFNTKGWPDEPISDDLNDRPIPSNCNNWPNEDYDNGNNVPGTPVDDDLLDN